MARTLRSCSATWWRRAISASRRAKVSSSTRSSTAGRNQLVSSLAPLSAENGVAPVAQFGRGSRLKPGPGRVQPPPGACASSNRLDMGYRSEEDPDEDPDEPDEPNHPGDGAAVGTQMVPNVRLPSRELDVSTQGLTLAQAVG